MELLNTRMFLYDKYHYVDNIAKTFRIFGLAIFMKRGRVPRARTDWGKLFIICLLVCPLCYSILRYTRQILRDVKHEASSS